MRTPPRCPARRRSLALGWQPCGSRRPTNCRASSGPDPRGGRAAETRTLAPLCQPRASPGAHSDLRRPTPTQAPVPRPRRFCLPGPHAPPQYPSGPSVPAALRTTRCSMPGDPETAPVITTATATKNARAQAGAPITGAGVTTSSGGARQHAAPHGPVLAPAGGRHSGVCWRRQATRYSGAQGRRRRWQGSCAPAPPIPVRPARRRPGLPGRLAPAAASPPRSLPPPSLPGCCRALPGRRRRRLQTFQSWKPAPRPGPATETARDPSPPRALDLPRARLDPSRPPGPHAPTWQPRAPDSLSAALARARCPPAQRLHPVPPAVSSAVRPCARPSWTARRQLPAPPPPPPPRTEPGLPGARQPVGAGLRPPRPAPATPALARSGAGTRPSPGAVRGRGRGLPRLCPRRGLEGVGRDGGARRSRRAWEPGSVARPPVALLGPALRAAPRGAGAQRARAQASICTARSPG